MIITILEAIDKYEQKQVLYYLDDKLINELDASNTLLEVADLKEFLKDYKDWGYKKVNILERWPLNAMSVNSLPSRIAKKILKMLLIEKFK